MEYSGAFQCLPESLWESIVYWHPLRWESRNKDKYLGECKRQQLARGRSILGSNNIASDSVGGPHYSGFFTKQLLSLSGQQIFSSTPIAYFPPLTSQWRKWKQEKNSHWNESQFIHPRLKIVRMEASNASSGLDRVLQSYVISYSYPQGQCLPIKLVTLNSFPH